MLLLPPSPSLTAWWGKAGCSGRIGVVRCARTEDSNKKVKREMGGCRKE